MHPAQGALRAFMDRQLPADEHARLADHLAQCERCGAELHALRVAATEVSAALGLLSPPPAQARAYAGLRRERRRRALRVTLVPALQRAAVLLLFVAGLASATVPGSPVREWLESIWRAVTIPDSPAARSRPDSQPDLGSTGLSISPGDGEVRVILEAPDPELRIHVRFHEEDHAEVQATGAAAGAQFHSGSGWIRVSGAAPGELYVDLPRGAHSAQLEVDGKVYLSKQGQHLEILVPVADSSGTRITFPVQP